ncbi:hypothetical protein [Sinorhizobium meliloti]|uniref:hypothetical protein n=1 Tax=Rhizobium meliloti TaxID=382 RepID=UPI000B4A2DEE|nr:hypothetical protein [Sinorhizobium meliloti]ASP51934.1 hypothetical protein CDO31_10470 [Sinorhizobium meliloti]
MGKDKHLYWVWADMLSRCRNPNHRQFNDYGGRGITVCQDWQVSFENFARDMAPRPAGMMLDRVENDGPYCPQNCRWATRKEQNSNRRNCIYVNDGAEKVTLREYCRRHRLTYRPIVKRIQDRHWPVEAALSIPLGSGKQFSCKMRKAG